MDAWLAPLQLNEHDVVGAKPHHGGTRASDKGFLSMTLAEYSTLLDWTGRQKRPDKQGKIPDNLQPILERIGIEGSMWCDLVWDFSKYFGKCYAAGKPVNLQKEAENRNIAWSRGQRSCRALLCESSFFDTTLSSRFPTALCLAVRAFSPILRHFRLLLASISAKSRTE
ncbi:MAG: hypothetical protein U0905_08190 [Pirellulales bacterium]